MPTRIDIALWTSGFASSRSHGRRIVLEGRARLNGVPVTRPSTPVLEGDDLTVHDVPVGGEYVSRGAYKLVGALEDPALGVDPRGVRALDIGASTGGFTDALLRAGALSVVAVDVGHGQLVDSLVRDPRVVSLEGTDARTLTPEVTGPIDLVVSDVSFISLTHLTEVMARVMRPGGRALVMVKPQFEVGRSRLPKSGVVSDPLLWRDAIEAVAHSASTHGLRLTGLRPSVLRGADGNREFFLALTRTEAPCPLGASEYDMIARGVRAAVAEGRPRRIERVKREAFLAVRAYGS